MRPDATPDHIGRYEIIEQLGFGGMGMVYRAHDPKIGRDVAVKLLRLATDDIRNRFLLEARSAGRLKHPNIVTVYDFGEHGGQPFIVMELIEGATLGSLLKEHRPFTLARKLELVEALAHGLEYAHARGVVHRDIKPANLMIDRDGVLRILDFGVARVADSGISVAGAVMGTPNYMSPEQVNGKPVDRRSDIFAVGLVLYEMLTGRQAFSGDTAPQVMYAIAWGVPAPVERLCPGLPSALTAIVNRALEKDVERRYQTLREMAQDLAEVRRRLPAADDHQAGDATIIHDVVTPQRTTPRSTSRDHLSRRRAALIESHLTAARHALEAGNFPVAIEACEQAALIDPDAPAVVALMDRVQAEAEGAQIRQWAAEAQQALSREQVDDANAVIDRILHLNAAAAEGLALREQARAVEARVRQQRERDTRIRESFARAEATLARGQAEAAIRMAGEVLALDPQHAGARSITQQALELIEHRQAEHAHERAARDAVVAANLLAADGRLEEAVGALQSFRPPHPLVGSALGTLTSRLVELRDREQREQQERLERERQTSVRAEREEAERQRIRSEVDRLIGRAEEALNRGQLDDAAEAVVRATTLDPGADVTPLRRRLDAARRAIAEQEQAAARIAEARRLFAEGNRDAALRHLREAPPHPLVHITLRELEKAHRAVLEREQEEHRRAAALEDTRQKQRAAIEDEIGRARRELTGGSLDAGAAIVERLRREVGVGHPAADLAPAIEELMDTIRVRQTEQRVREEITRASAREAARSPASAPADPHPVAKDVVPPPDVVPVSNRRWIAPALGALALVIVVAVALQQWRAAQPGEDGPATALGDTTGQGQGQRVVTPAAPASTSASDGAGSGRGGEQPAAGGAEGRPPSPPPQERQDERRVANPDPGGGTSRAPGSAAGPAGGGSTPDPAPPVPLPSAPVSSGITLPATVPATTITTPNPTGGEGPVAPADKGKEGDGGPPPSPAIDQAAATRLLRTFYERYGAFDVAGVRLLFPRLAENEINRIRALDKTYRACSYSFSPPEIKEAAGILQITVATVETCVPDRKAPDQILRTSDLFQVVKGPAGAWIITARFSM